MSEHTLISVRGEAERVVAPDAARLSTTISATAPSKADASGRVARVVAGLTVALTEMGGQVLTIATMRASLTWSVGGIRSHEQWNHDSDERRLVGHRSIAELAIRIREFEQLERLAQVLATHDEIDVQSVSWSVDEDNPEWAQVRADAIHAALLKGRDYAAALGGTVVRVEHVADGGLLGGEPARPSEARRAMSLAFAQSADVEAVSLDPVPQTITAIIEARVTATVGPLPS